MSERTIPIWRFKNGSGWADLYYYNGNFFFPIFLATKEIERVVWSHIRAFRKSNKELVKADRKHPDYRNKVYLAKLQGL